MAGGCSSSVVIIIHNYWFNTRRGILILYFLPIITLALITCLVIFSTTSQLLPNIPHRPFIINNNDLLFFKSTDHHHHHHLVGDHAAAAAGVVVEYDRDHELSLLRLNDNDDNNNLSSVGVVVVQEEKSSIINSRETPEEESSGHRRMPPVAGEPYSYFQSQWSQQGILFQQGAKGQNVDKSSRDDVFHDKTLFFEEYKEMNKTLKIYTYPHPKNHPFANILLIPKQKQEKPTGGNYASEIEFKKNLFKSHFITNNPSEAHLFFLPFSIASLRHDPRIGVAGIQEFVRSYVENISREYPYWNRTGGADHFYVACHSIGRSAMDKAVGVKNNAIQVVCSSSYFITGYVSHKDASVPQIWPRNENPPPYRSPEKRGTLAFYAGAMNSGVRKSLVEQYENDSEISVHRNRLKTPYSESLLGSKFCIHAKGFEVNTARIGDAFYYGCVPVILSDYYDLPFADVLNWNSFSVVVSAVDIPNLKKMLREKVNNYDCYLRLHENVMKVRKHFQWNKFAVDYDAFYMVMYELWIRRSHVRVF